MLTKIESISGPIHPVEKILILVGVEPTADKLFLSARQYSGGGNTEWFAVCVDPGEKASPACRAQFNDNLTIALHSGAQVIHMLDNDKISGIVNLVIQNKINRILMGNFNAGRFMSSFVTGFYKKQLSRKLQNVEINQILIENRNINGNGGRRRNTTKPIEYLLALGAVILTASFCLIIKNLIGYQTVGLILLILTAVLSLSLGRGAVIFTAFLNFFVWNFFFIQPILTFHVESFHDSIILFANLVVAITGGSLITRLRRSQAEQEISRERITLLYSLLESLNNADSINEVVAKVRSELKRHFDGDAIIYLKNKKGKTLDKNAFGNQELFNEDEFENAVKVFEQKDHGQIIKLNEKHLIQYFPLSGKRETIGVIGIATENNYPVDEDKLIFLKSFITHITSALEREISIDKSKEIQVNGELQKLFHSVLNNVSRELRRSAAILNSAVLNLSDENIVTDPENQRKICSELDSASARLNTLADKILNKLRIDPGPVNLNL